ncbi:MAG: ABC transporter ATP-binding protein [Prevotella sp.]|jgi:ABC-type multidrug transport system fused ATPase/permease subunit
MKIKEILRIPETHYTSRQIFCWLWRASKTNRTQAIINASIGLLSVGVSLAQVWAVQHAIDVAAGNIPGSLLKAVGFMGLLILANFGLNITSVWVRNILGIRAQNRMQQRMLDRILRTEWHGKESLHSGDVLNRLEFDVSNVVIFITETLPNVLSVLTMFFGAFFYLFSLDRILALITVAIIPVFIIFSKIYISQMRHYTRQVRDSDSKVQSVLQETIQNRMLFKTLESDDTAVNRLEHTQSELHQNVVRRTKFSLFSNLMLNFGFALGYLLAFAWAAIRMSRHTLTFGGMTAYLQLVNRIQGPARNLTKLVPAFVSVFTAAERLMELEENPLEEQGEPVMFDVPCGVKVSHVYYQYSEAERLVINDLSFDFKPGTSTAIMGETGAGKTTLIRIILALLKPQQGSVTIYDNHKRMKLTPRMRCNIVYVPQGNTLLSGTIRDNLRLGRLGATDQEMADALHTACADFVFDLPDGLDTECSESGGGLSEGQAQRISIARALLRDRSIMLFDEATSALDPDTERKLLGNILGRHDRTILFITHRQAVVDYCDQTLHLVKFHKKSS